jgi:hypothetical protein
MIKNFFREKVLFYDYLLLNLDISPGTGGADFAPRFSYPLFLDKSGKTSTPGRQQA